MARPRSQWRDYLVYLAVRTLVCILSALSWRVCLAVADMLAALLYRIDRRHHVVAAENLRHAFPELSDSALDLRVREVYRHFAVMSLELLFLHRKLHRSNFLHHISYPNPTDYERAITTAYSGRPVIVLTGHFGNWEVFSRLLGLDGHHGAVIARKLDNPYLDAFVSQLRARTGQRFIDKDGAVGEIETCLAKNESLGMLCDQDAGARGVFVDFFGRPASTFKSIALLSLEYNLPIIVYGAARASDDFRYLLYVPAIIFPEEYAKERDPVRAITQRFTAALEWMVRKHPEQYFWLHRRWKHQPKVRGASRQMGATAA